MKFRVLIFIVVLGAVLLPGRVFAVTESELEALIRRLQEQIAALQLAANSKPPQGNQVTNIADSGTQDFLYCLTSMGSLKQGNFGEDVRELQSFLAQDASVYPEKLVTGYYGALTVKAVQKWQAKQDIVFSGTPDTTGFGAVGPMTISKLNTARRCVPRPPAPGLPTIIFPRTGDKIIIGEPVAIKISQPLDTARYVFTYQSYPYCALKITPTTDLSGAYGAIPGVTYKAFENGATVFTWDAKTLNPYTDSYGLCVTENSVEGKLAYPSYLPTVGKSYMQFSYRDKLTNKDYISKSGVFNIELPHGVTSPITILKPVGGETFQAGVTAASDMYLATSQYLSPKNYVDWHIVRDGDEKLLRGGYFEDVLAFDNLTERLASWFPIGKYRAKVIARDPYNKIIDTVVSQPFEVKSDAPPAVNGLDFYFKQRKTLAIKGIKQGKIGEFFLQAGSGEPVNVSRMSFNVDEDNILKKDSLSNLKLIDENGNIVSSVDFINTTPIEIHSINFSLSLTLSPGQKKIFSLYGDIAPAYPYNFIEFLGMSNKFGNNISAHGAISNGYILIGYDYDYLKPVILNGVG